MSSSSSYVNTKIIDLPEIADGDIVDLSQAPYSLPATIHLFGLVGVVDLSHSEHWASLMFRDGASSTDNIFAFNVSTLDVLNQNSYSAILEDDSYVRISNGLSVKFDGEFSSTALTRGYVMAIYQ